MLIRIALLCALVLPVSSVLAAEVRYNQVDFTSSAEQRVNNDLMTANLGVEVNAAQSDEVAREINDKLNAALKIASGYGNVRTASGNQFTQPVYDKTGVSLHGWRGRASIHLESRNFEEMGKLIAALQQTMEMQGVSFTLSAETRERVENELIGKAIAAFRQRAKRIVAAMGGRDYKVVHLAINQGGGYIRPMLARKAMSEVQFSAGDSTMTVQASGTIEVVR